jgi:hypothetical protein
MQHSPLPSKTFGPGLRLSDNDKGGNFAAKNPLSSQKGEKGETSTWQGPVISHPLL